MRIAVGDPCSRVVLVTLDGVPTDDAILADEERGTLVVFRRGHDGRLIHNGRKVLTTRVHGSVQLTLRDNASDAERKHFAWLRAQKRPTSRGRRKW